MFTINTIGVFVQHDNIDNISSSYMCCCTICINTAYFYDTKHVFYQMTITTSLFKYVKLLLTSMDE